MSVSPELQSRVAEWRQKARDGTLTLDEMKQAIIYLRGERTAMAATSKTKSKAPSVSGDDLLSELGI